MRPIAIEMLAATLIPNSWNPTGWFEELLCTGRDRRVLARELLLHAADVDEVEQTKALVMEYHRRRFRNHWYKLVAVDGKDLEDSPHHQRPPNSSWSPRRA